MRAVVVHVREEELADRRAKGLEHQRILDAMIEFLRPRLRDTGRGMLVSGINAFSSQRGCIGGRMRSSLRP